MDHEFVFVCIKYSYFQIDEGNKTSCKETLLNKNIKVVPELVVTVAVHVLKKIQDDIVRISRMQ